MNTLYILNYTVLYKNYILRKLVGEGRRFAPFNKSNKLRASTCYEGIFLASQRLKPKIFWVNPFPVPFVGISL